MQHNFLDGLGGIWIWRKRAAHKSERQHDANDGWKGSGRVPSFTELFRFC